MSDSPICKKCGSPNLRWTTIRRHVPVDVLQCEACGTLNTEEDWIAPLMPMKAGRCVNCGDHLVDERCMNCGLSEEEDLQVHDELRNMVSPSHNLLNAAREASRRGRRLLALKLASAAAARNEDGMGEVARALRIWLLWDIGEAAAALEDAKAWTEATADPSAIAWASLGQQQQHANMPGAAADAYMKALDKDPDQHSLRARLSQVLLSMGREGRASEEACRIFEAQADDRSISMVLEVAESLAESHRKAMREDEIDRLLTRAGAYAKRSPLLLAHRARLAAINGDVTTARRYLKKAMRLQPDLPIYKEVERAIKPQRTSWWRW